MNIIGRGMIARALLPYESELSHVTIFASGVADSATTDPAAYQREINLLQNTLRRRKHENHQLVYFSSGGAIYGPTDALRNENTPAAPTTTYGQHQIHCEEIIRTSGAAHLIIRLPNLVGSGQNTSQLVPAMIRQAITGKATLFRHATRDLLDVEDFAALTMKLLRHGVTNETVILASGISHPIHVIFGGIQAILKTQAEVVLLDKGDQQRFDISRLKHLLDETLNFGDDYLDRILNKYVTDPS